MADKQPASASHPSTVLAALRHALNVAEASLASLAGPAQSPQPALDLPLLHKDFISILSFIYASTTRVSLVLKPSEPSYKAALEPLQELSDRLASLPHCLRLIQADHGKTLALEASATARDVLQAARTLFQTFLAIYSTKHIPHNGDDYLIRAGALHDIIEKARSKDGFSKDNLAAVIKLWRRNQEALDDGRIEVQDTMDSTENGAEDAFDDGWDELGLSSGLKPSATEMERIKKIHAIVRLSTLFHQRALQDILSPLSPSTPLPPEANRVLDDLALASSEFLVSSDNFVSTMYPPQLAVNLSHELDNYQRHLVHLQASLDPLTPADLSGFGLQGLQLAQPPKTPEHYAKLHKWRTACINQINKNIHELSRELKEVEIA